MSDVETVRAMDSGTDEVAGADGDAPAPREAPAVKICGLTRPEDARRASEAGAAYLGIVLVPGTPRAVSVLEAGRIGGGLGPSLVLVSADTDPDRVARDAEEAGAQVLQLHGEEPPEHARRLRERGPWKIWKSVRVRRREDVERAVERYAEVVDGLHLDGWHRDRIGGSGARFSWSSVGHVRSTIPAELTLVVAGGLTPENVGDAVRALRPDVVDVSSGVESAPDTAPGVKDADRIVAFVEAALRPGGGR